MKYCAECGAKLKADAKFCGECGAKVKKTSGAKKTTTKTAPKKAAEPVKVEKKGNTALIVTLICVGGACLLGLGIYFTYKAYHITGGTTNIFAGAQKKCRITKAEFDKIQKGMSYTQISRIVGCEGTELTSLSIGKGDYAMYYWYGNDGISNANVTISNGKCINKTQIGLK